MRYLLAARAVQPSLAGVQVGILDCTVPHTAVGAAGPEHSLVAVAHHRVAGCCMAGERAPLSGVGDLPPFAALELWGMMLTFGVFCQILNCR